MAIVDWIDKLADVAGSVSDGRGGFVKAYRNFDRADIPEQLTVFPCAISFDRSMTPKYSAGLCLNIWEGTTEFYLFPNINPQNNPEVMRYYDRILAAFAAHVNLWSTVGYCKLNRIERLSPPTYGAEIPMALIASWTVKEEVTGDFTVA
jgi:hypothetical protein